MSRAMNPVSFPNKQRGVGLLEVLISVLILAVGLLGLAGLQAQALKTNHSSFQRSQAVMLSYVIIDSMRADMASAIAGGYNLNAPVCVIGPAGILADNNKRRWFQALKANLGDTADTCGQITCIALAPTADCTVTVWWDDSRAGGGIQQSIVTRTRL